MAHESVRVRELLANPTLRLLLLADLADGMGTWAFTTVFSLSVFERTHSVVLITVAVSSRWIAQVTLGPVAGVIADRYDRSRVMVISAAGSAVLMTALAAGNAVGVAVAPLIALSVAQAVVTSFYGPAFAATLPQIVPERLLATANGARETVANLAVVGGPAVGALLLLTGSSTAGIAFNAASFLVPIIVLLKLGIHSRGSGSPGANPLTEFTDGVRALLSERTAVVLVLAMALDSAIAGIGTSLALPISRYVGSGTQHYGYLLIASSIGSVAAAGLSGRYAARRKLAGFICGGLLVESLPFAVTVAVPHAVPAAILQVVSGAGMIVVDLITVTALQRDLRNDLLGRVFGMLDTTILATVAVSVVLGGLLVDAVGVPACLLAVGLGVPVIVLACLPVLLETDRRVAARVAALEPVVALLTKLDLFDGAERPALERLAAAATPVSVPSGTVVLREGDAADAVWLLVQGRLGVSSDARADLPDVVSPGYVGEIGVLHNRPRTATVTALEDCVMYTIEAQTFGDALTGNAASSSLTRLSGMRLARTERVSVPVGQGNSHPA